MNHLNVRNLSGLGQPSSYFTGLTSNIQNQINNASATTYQNTFNNSTLTNDFFFLEIKVH